MQPPQISRPWIDPADRQFVRRSVIALCVFFAAFTFFARTWRFFEQKFYVTTGPGEWIWVTNPMRAERPVAFFATRDFEIPAEAAFVHINILAEPEYDLYFNGRRIAVEAFRAEHRIRSYDVTSLRRKGPNRIVVGCRGEKGAGGLLLSVDFSSMNRNAVVSDRHWKLYQFWDERLLEHDLPHPDDIVRSFGPPPVGRWNFPERVDAEIEGAQQPLQQPLQVIPFRGRIPETRILSGIAVASARPVPARAFDFGEVVGRACLSREGGETEVIRVRFGQTLDELSGEGEILPVVFASGEKQVIVPGVRQFRYVAVFGGKGTLLVEPIRR